MRQSHLESRKFFLGISLFFFFANFLFATEYNWGKDYKIYIRPVSEFASEMKIIEVKTNKVLHESLLGMHAIIKTKQKKIAGKNIFFIQTTTGGEGMVSSNLYYFYMNKNDLKQGAVEDIIDFSLRNLDEDKNRELILTDFKYYKFRVNNCYNALEPDPHYTGKLFPQIYKFNGDKFVEEKSDKEFLKKYLEKLEKKLLKKKKFKNVYGYSHYYAIAKKVGLDSKALTFLKANNSEFTYECENTNEYNPKGKSFRLKTTYYDFFKRYGKEIKN